MTVWVYMLRCGDGSLYTGMTTRLEVRLRQHRDKTARCKFTRRADKHPLKLAAAWAAGHPAGCPAAGTVYQGPVQGAEAKPGGLPSAAAALYRTGWLPWAAIWFQARGRALYRRIEHDESKDPADPGRRSSWSC